jgi:hypothetical protein
MSNLVSDLGSIEKRTLFAGTEIPALPTTVTIVSGQGVLSAGSIIGKITASGKGAFCKASATDGSQVADLVLAEDVDATSVDVVALAYKTGIFNYDSLAVATGDTVAAHMQELRLRNIHYRTDV